LVIYADTLILTQAPAMVPTTGTPSVPIINNIPIDNSIEIIEFAAAIEVANKYASTSIALVVSESMRNSFSYAINRCGVPRETNL